jgi:hypothetical protein
MCLVPWHWTWDAKVLEYRIIFSLKIKLNHSWKIRRNWNVPLVFLERSWWARFNGIYFVRFGFRMWEILILKWFFETLEGLPLHSSMISFDIWLFKKLIHNIAKQCSHVEFPYFVMGSHLGQWHMPH